jgi:uncharacterized membrane protein
MAWAWAAVLTAAYSALSVSNYLRYEIRSWDLAIFTQTVAGYAGLGAPIVDLKGPGLNVLGDHFSPLLAVLAPFYRIWPSPVTLLIAQALLVGISAAVVLQAAIKHLGRAAGVSVGIAYGISFGLQSGVDSDFHEFALAVPLLALSGSAYLDRDWRRCSLWALPLLLVKEDLGLTVAALGVALMLSGGRRWGLPLLLAGMAGFVLTVGVIIPAISPEGSYPYWSRFAAGSRSSGGPLDAVGGLLTSAVSPPVKIETLLVTLAVTGALALRSPFVVLAVPNLAERFLGDVPFYWGIDWHYSLPLMPVLFIALVDGVLRARTGRTQWLAAYAAHVPAVAAAVALLLTLTWPLPLRTLAEAETWQPAPRADAAEQALAAVPPGATVETDLGLLSHLVADRQAYWIGDSSPVIPDYFVIDSGSGTDISTVGSVSDAAEQQHPGTRYETVVEAEGYQVARRVD